jgi:phospholipid/cholesterol/gamma-HCH transport system substrate-binding protein
VLPTSPTDVLPTQLDPDQLLQDVMACINSGSLSSAACVKVLDSAQALAKLKEVCQEPANRTKSVCVVLNNVPGLPAGPAASSDSDPLGDVLGGALGGLGRSATGPWNDAADGGPTMAQLQSVYDPSLVNLLVPQLVVQNPKGSSKAGEGE